MSKAVCDVEECYESQEWEPCEEYTECPEGWGYLLLSDSKGELQGSLVCPEHCKRAWDALRANPRISSTAKELRRIASNHFVSVRFIEQFERIGPCALDDALYQDWESLANETRRRWSELAKELDHG